LRSTIKVQGHRKTKYGQLSTLGDISYRTNRLWEFYQSYKLDAVGDKYEPSRFWDQKIKGQGHDNAIYGQKSVVKQCTFLSPAYQSMFYRQRPSGYLLL